MLSTLLRAGFSASDLESPELTKMTEVLQASFTKENGALGFGMAHPFYLVIISSLLLTL
jgi:hypothetical protein